MKRIIGGKAYNTETSTILASVDVVETKLTSGTLEPGGNPQFKKVIAGRETLYQTQNGAFFLVKARSDDAAMESHSSFQPMNRRDAIAWAERDLDSSKIEAIFGVVEEAGSQARSMLLRIPENLKKRMEAAAEEAEQSVHAWMLRCAEDCCKRDELVHALAIAEADLFDLTFERGIFTPDGYQRVASHALDAVRNALKALNITDVSKTRGGDVSERPNWAHAREYADIRTEKWRD